MDLSKIDIKPRVRNNWEAIDLGFIMARSWWRIAFLSWLIPAAVIYLILTIVFIDNDWLALLITWWGKPLWDRGPLYIASRRLFGEQVTLRDFFRQLPRLYKTDLIACLSWRRLSFTRSFDMPVTVLEQLKGSQRQSRLRTLHLRSSNAASWLTITCVHLEAFMWLGCIGFFMLLVPEQIDIDIMQLAITEDIIAMLISNTLSFFCMTLIGPFYAIAGFALYINRRIELEAWDLEIRFRHLAQNRHKRAAASTTLICALLTGLLLIFQPEPTYAENMQHMGPEQSRETIDEVLRGKDFYNETTVTRWRLKDKEETEEESEWIKALVRFLVEWIFDQDFESGDEKTQVTIPKVIELLMWVALIGITGYLIYRVLLFYDVIMPRGQNKKQGAKATPDVLFGLDVSEHSLPDDVAAQTIALWHQGQHREAIGLLYRSTLSILIHRYQYQFSEGNTEQECATIVAQSAQADITDFVKRITGTWQMLAYAHRIPVETQVEELCKQWPKVMQDEK